MKYNELIRLLKDDGWFELRQSGSHLVMRHSSKSNQIVVPSHGSKEIGRGLQKKILKQAGIKQ